jgi:hypothetical protein
MGDAGRGKSTLAEKLSEKLGIQHYSTDDFYYEYKFFKIQQREKAIEQVIEIYKKDHWIMEGTTHWLLEPGLDSANLIIYLRYKTIFLQWLTIIKRHFQRKDESIISTLGLLRHVFYKRYGLGYKKGKITDKEILALYKQKVITLSSFKDIDNFLNSFKKDLPIITFIVDKELDLENHLISLGSYKRNGRRIFSVNEAEKLEKLLSLPIEQVRNIIKKDIEPLYDNPEKLITLAKEINEEWGKIEKKFISKLEEVHKFSFLYKSIRGVLSTATRFGYNLEQGWFATDPSKDKFVCMNVAMHELMHFMFHKYYDEVCKKAGLAQTEMWDIKESFTVLLNLEFKEFISKPDFGYPPHQELRAVIEKTWIQNRDFDKALAAAIEFVKGSRK